MRTHPAKLIAVGLLAVLSGSAGAQIPTNDTSPSAPQFSSTVNYVLLPVVVTDTSGRHVGGLTAADFEVRENGKAQSIRSVEEIEASTAPLSRAVPPDTHEFTNEVASGGVSRRLVILVLDMVNNQFKDQVAARRGLVKYLATRLDPECLYEIVAIERKGPRILHDYTEQTAELIRVANAVSAGQSQISTNFGGFDTFTRSTGTEQALRGALAAENEIQEALDANLTLSTFRAIAAHVVSVPGRKELIWLAAVSPLHIDPVTSEVRSDFVSQSLYRETVRLLEDALISIYPVDPSGLDPAQPIAAEHYSAREMRNGKLLNELSTIVHGNHDDLRSVADLTGGRAFLDRNDTDRAMHEALQDGSSYYLLSYAIDKKDMHPGWRKISVRARDYHVRARSGYFLTDATTIRASSTTAIDEALTSPVDCTGLPVHLKFAENAGGKHALTFKVVVREPAPRSGSADDDHLDMSFAYVVRNSSGDDVGHKGTTLVRHLSAAESRHVESDGLGYSDTIELAPGQYSVRVVARDNLNGRIGSVQGTITLQ